MMILLKREKMESFFFILFSRSGFNRHKSLRFQPSDIGHIAIYFFLSSSSCDIKYYDIIGDSMVHTIFYFLLNNITLLVISSCGLDV